MFLVLDTMGHLTRGWLLVLVGGLLLAVGGILTTLGWNTLRERSQMRTLISAVAREWEINNNLLTAEPLFTGSDDAALSSHRLYPRLYTNATAGVLASGLFNPAKQRDRLLLRAVADYQESVRDVNSRLSVSDGFVTSTQDLGKIRDHRRHVLQSPGFKGLLRQHARIGDLLKAEYKWAEQRFLD